MFLIKTIELRPGLYQMAVLFISVSMTKLGVNIAYKVKNRIFLGLRYWKNQSNVEFLRHLFLKYCLTKFCQAIGDYNKNKDYFNVKCMKRFIVDVLLLKSLFAKFITSPFCKLSCIVWCAFPSNGVTLLMLLHMYII